MIAEDIAETIGLIGIYATRAALAPQPPSGLDRVLKQTQT